jgi:hypothetical protein
MRLIIVMDERCAEGEEADSALVGVFTSIEAANRAIKKVQNHWKKFDEGSEADCHNLTHFDFDGELDNVTIPVYEDAVGEEDDDDEEGEEDEDEDEDKDDEDDEESDEDDDED